MLIGQLCFLLYNLTYLTRQNISHDFPSSSPSFVGSWFICPHWSLAALLNPCCRQKEAGMGAAFASVCFNGILRFCCDATLTSLSPLFFAPNPQHSLSIPLTTDLCRIGAAQPNAHLHKNESYRCNLSLLDLSSTPLKCLRQNSTDPMSQQCGYITF